MIYYVDIDETICYYEDGERDYLRAKPDYSRIKKINSLYEEGNVIVYWTARGSQTGLDWTDLTIGQLKEWGAKYTKAILGKPHYHYFICDKAINSEKFFSIQDNE
jgi:hypothetical protein